MISYPRKCPHCEYMSNNPSMYLYHKQIHLAIPENTYCHFGCGHKATSRNTGGKYTCKTAYQECSAYIDQLKERTTRSWLNSDERKTQVQTNQMNTLEANEKRKETRRLKFGLLTPEIAKQYRSYARAIRQRAQKWAKEQGYVLGKQTYHVDHKFSILDSWHAELKAEIVNHPANLEIMEAKKNSGKGSKSSITLEELMSLISNS